MAGDTEDRPALLTFVAQVSNFFFITLGLIVKPDHTRWFSNPHLAIVVGETSIYPEFLKWELLDNT